MISKEWFCFEFKINIHTLLKELFKNIFNETKLSCNSELLKIEQNLNSVTCWRIRTCRMYLEKASFKQFLPLNYRL